MRALWRPLMWAAVLNLIVAAAAAAFTKALSSGRATSGQS